MPKRKLSSSYIRKREDIKNAVVQRSIEKIRIAAHGPGYRTSGQIKGGNALYLGSPAGTKVKTNSRTGNQTTVAKIKAINPNRTKKVSKNVKARSKPIVATATRPYRPIAGKLRPISNEEIRRRMRRSR